MATTFTTQEKSKNYFKKQIKCLKLAGISLTGNESIAYKLYSSLLVFSTVYAYAVLDGYELFKHDFETSSTIIIYESIVIVAMIKIAIVWINRIKFGKLLAKLEQEPFLPKPTRGGDEEERLIRECNWKIDVQTIVYWITSVIGLSIFCGYALSTRLRSNDYHKWELPCGPLTVLNMTYSSNYEITLFYQSFSIFIVAIHFTTIDLTILGVLAHVSCQFKILQNFLKVIIKRSYEEMLKDQTNSADKMTTLDHNIDASKIPWKYLQKSIKQAVRYHQAIINIAKEMEEFFRYLLMLAFLITSVSLCFELYNTSSQKTTAGFLRHLLEISVCLFQVGMISYWGEQVIFESEQVMRASYSVFMVVRNTNK